MAFGQTSGPPASAKQLSYLLSLVKKAGHEGFRDARGPLGLTQRQAGGKFTGREASELIDRLVKETDGTAGDDEPTGASVAAQQRLDDHRADVLRGMPADALAVELERRGWHVTPPTTRGGHP